MSESESAGLAELMPRPRRLERLAGAPLGAGRPLQPSFAAVRTPRLVAAVARWQAVERQPAGAGAPLPLVIRCANVAARYPALDDDESYTLRLGAEGVELSAPGEWGVLHGLTTLMQLRGAATPLPALQIDDAPRFPWRGLMLDVARHFIPAADLRRTLDAMAVFKLNVLHLHLSDDQAFRFPSRRYPRLTSEDHYRPGELEALVEHAAERGIRVVPELDVPGHTTHWLLAYPDWGNRPARPSRRFGVHQECLDPTRPQVLDAVAGLFTELAATFPDQYLHLGGDEVEASWWSQDPRIRSFLQRHDLADERALQAWFNARVSDALEGLGRRPIGWDEVLHPHLPDAVTVQAWRGATARDRALAGGHDCVVSAPYYLDLLYPAEVHYGFDPAAAEHELLAREDALLEDPRFAHVAGGMAWTRQWRSAPGTRAAPQRSGRLLGAEACLWSELVDARSLDIRLWSRMPALAERFWSPADCRDPEDLYRRLTVVLERLAGWAGVDVARDQRGFNADAGVSAAWQPLVDLLEPVKWYGRLLGEEALAARLRGREMPKARPYHADTPLNRVVDGLPPESMAARRLAALARAEAGGDRQARSQLRRLAREWQALPAGAGPAELETPAARLRELGALVLAVLDGQQPAARAVAQARAAAGPWGEYLLAAGLVLAHWLERRPADIGDV